MSAPLLFALMHAFERYKAADLPAHHRLVLLVLADFADDTSKAWPSAQTIATRSGQSRSTVELCLDELEEGGWIAGERRGAGKRRLSTVFMVRVEGRPVRRARPGRHSPAGGELDTMPPTPCPPRHAPHAMPPPMGSPAGDIGSPRGGERGSPRGEIDSPRGGEDPTKDPTRSDPTKDPPREPGALTRATTPAEEQASLALVEPPVRDPVTVVWSAYIEARAARVHAGSAPRFTGDRKQLIQRRLKDFPAEDLADACRGVFLCEHNVEGNYTGIELVLRDAGHIERFRDIQRRGALVPRDRSPPAREREPSPALQRPAAPGERTWKPAEEVSF